MENAEFLYLFLASLAEFLFIVGYMSKRERTSEARLTKIETYLGQCCNHLNIKINKSL